MKVENMTSYGYIVKRILILVPSSSLLKIALALG